MNVCQSLKHNKQTGPVNNLEMAARASQQQKSSSDHPNMVCIYDFWCAHSDKDTFKYLQQRKEVQKPMEHTIKGKKRPMKESGENIETTAVTSTKARSKRTKSLSGGTCEIHEFIVTLF